MIEFINARTGEVLDAGQTAWLRAIASRTMTDDDAAIEYAGILAAENGDDVYVRWDAGAGSEGRPDTLVERAA